MTSAPDATGSLAASDKPARMSARHDSEVKTTTAIGTGASSRHIPLWTENSRSDAAEKVHTNCLDALRLFMRLAAEMVDPDPLGVTLLLDGVRLAVADSAMTIASQTPSNDDVSRADALAPGVRALLVESQTGTSSTAAIGQSVRALACVYRWNAYLLEHVLDSRPPREHEVVAEALTKAFHIEADLAPELPVGTALYGGEIASVYDRFRPQRVEFREAVAEIAQRWLRGRTVLELGAGTGRVGSLLLGKVGHYVGIDLAPEMLREFARRAPGANLMVADALHLPLAAESVDAVVEHEALSFTADPFRATDEAFRVLRGGGDLVRIVVSAVGADPLRNLHDAFRRGAARVRPRPFHMRAHGTDERITAYLERRGTLTQHVVMKTWDETMLVNDVCAMLESRSHPYLVGISARSFQAGMREMLATASQAETKDGRIITRRELQVLISGKRA